ncbi:glycosyltransferase [Bifidobacterium sp. 64T4]|uniref:glycosyltransferase family 2 protein n=1 Tax=Bifidobacterium pongonis TaxID=2834432 RepID=UPI001C577913|nr:glycosyltransferase [Bifidobacterium pongonis]MBW3095447.1 glycosyltransferase [Bifidobacterium pongonis]
MGKQLSIIIPAFNAERNLHRCLDGLLSQADESCQVIVVNDGSQDGTGDICASYGERITYIDKRNGGVSSARNAGLKAALGEYVTFVDSDDFVSEDFIASALGEMATRKDVYFFLHQQDDAKAPTEPVPFGNEPSKEDIIRYALFSKGNPNPNVNFRSVWGKVIRRSLLDEHSITFPEGIALGEDMVFMLYVYSSMNAYSFVGKVAYHYFFFNPDSATNRSKPNMEAILEANDTALSAWMKEENNTGNDLYYYSYRLNDVILMLKFKWMFMLKHDGIRTTIREISDFLKRFDFDKRYDAVRNSELLGRCPASQRIIYYAFRKRLYPVIFCIGKLKYC